MKRIFIALLATLSLYSCSNKAEEDREELDRLKLKATWIIKSANGKELTTNEYIGYTFNEDNFNYSTWCDEGNGNSSWIDINRGYVIDGEGVVLNNGTAEAKRYDISFSSGELCGEKDYLIYMNSDDDKYVGIRNLKNYSSTILGIWEGKATEGRDINPLLRIEFRPKGLYLFYTKENGEWVLKEDNKGSYTLTGNLLGNEWVNDINSDIKGTMSEAWILSFEEDKMIWTATREDGKKERFEYTKINY